MLSGFSASISPIARQRGLTLVELMVGLIISLTVIGGVMTVYLAVITSSGDTLKSGKLNQEMGAMMSVMANDIRRAGTWGDIKFDALDDNPFSKVSSDPNAKDGTALEIHDSMAGDNNQVTTTSGTLTNEDIYLPNGVGSCVVYAYDSVTETTDPDEVRDIDLFGFRLNGTAVEMREKGDADNDPVNSCNNGDWGQMNDTNVVAITRLEFDMRPADTDGDGVDDKASGSSCLVSNEPNGEDENGVDGVDDALEEDCYRTSPYTSVNGSFSEEYIAAEIRVVTVTMEGELVDDDKVTAELRHTVRVRNDLLRVFD